jgi:hypothetical protein
MKKIGLTAILLLTAIGAKAQSCDPASGSSSTISSNCTGLNWNSGDVSINTGVTIDAIGSSNAVTIGPGVVGTLTNSGTLAGGSYSGIDTELNEPTITSIINTATGNITGGWGIYTYSGSVGSITNAGEFNVGSFGILNYLVTINEVNNTGAINSGVIGIKNFGTINTLTNSGSLSGGMDGIQNFGEIQTLVNTEGGTISGVSGHGIYNSQNITNLNNSGAIQGGSRGVFSDGDASRLAVINNLNNSGLISGTSTGVDLSLTRIDSFINSGTIESSNPTGNAFGIRISHGIIGTLLNSGSINASSSGNDVYVYGIINSGTISELSNAGVIAATSTGVNGITYGVYNGLGGTINTLTNTGTISAGDNGFGINNFGEIARISNTGFIIAGDLSVGIQNMFGTIHEFNNLGSITVNVGVGIYNVGTVGVLKNLGVITILSEWGGIENNSGFVDTLSNLGTIQANENGNDIVIGIVNHSSDGYPASLINTLTNSGSIQISGNGFGIVNRDAINTLINSGTITVGGVGAGIGNAGTISTLKNTGTISTGVGGGGIYNDGTIGLLNNAQGGNGSSPSTTALAYRDNLPNNYNIIINSATHYGQLAVTDPRGTITNFGIYGAPFITSRTYSSVLSGTALPTGASSGTYDNMTWSLTANGSAFDLVFAGVSLMGTQQSLVNTVSALQNTYALQNAVLTNSFSYDCPVFGAHNVCISAGGRNTAVSAANGLNNTSALLIAAYRLNKNIRLGAWVDQNLSTNSATGISLGNSKPLFGVFGAWAENSSGEGYEVKVSAGYGDKDLTVTRDVIGTSEAGAGTTRLNSQAISTVSSYGFKLHNDLVVSPYVGVQYSRVASSAYTETSTADVTAPLTYSRLSQENISILAGLKLSAKLDPKTALFGSVGIEQNVNNRSGQYSATGVDGLTSIEFNSNFQKTRATASAGIYYDLDKKQRISLSGIYRQEPFQAVSTTTVLATYTIGL